MSDEYIKAAESFLDWFEEFKKNISWREDLSDIEENVLRWADYTERDLGNYDLGILVETIETLQ